MRRQEELPAATSASNWLVPLGEGESPSRCLDTCAESRQNHKPILKVSNLPLYRVPLEKATDHLSPKLGLFDRRSSHVQVATKSLPPSAGMLRLCPRAASADRPKNQSAYSEMRTGPDRPKMLIDNLYPESQTHIRRRSGCLRLWTRRCHGQ